MKVDYPHLFQTLVSLDHSAETDSLAQLVNGFIVISYHFLHFNWFRKTFHFTEMAYHGEILLVSVDMELNKLNYIILELQETKGGYIDT